MNALAQQQDGVGEIEEQVKQFVISNFYVVDAKAVSNQTSLLDSGIVDSTGVLEVIEFIERDFGLTVEDAEVVPDNLDSIERIASFICRKLG